MSSSENEVKDVQGPITKGPLNFLKELQSLHRYLLHL